jgi:hypothetical protein
MDPLSQLDKLNKIDDGSAFFTVGQEDLSLIPKIVAISENEKLKDILNYAKGIAQTVSAKAYNKGRKDKVTRAMLMSYPLAQLSEILDTKTCELCKALDGHIISTRDIRFLQGKFDPPFHNYCRGTWIFIHKDEMDSQHMKPNWPKNIESIIEEHLDKGHLKHLHWKGL